MSENNEIKCCDKSLEFIVQTGEDWREYIPRISTCEKCGTYFERKPGKSIAYKRIETNSVQHSGEVLPSDGYYICTNCWGNIVVIKVAHPIWDGPLPRSGLGKCHYEIVPYCPNCEEEPNFHGKPIKTPFKL